MITNSGKSIIGKYLLGQAPAYASYIAIGCGAKPLQSSTPYGDYSAKTNLDFEMIRVPISSRGFVNDGGTEKLVLTAELPTEERYEITEVGIFSAGSNPSAGSADSKTVFAFTQGENWQYHDQTSASIIPTITQALDAPNNDNIIATTDPAFQTNADNLIFFNTTRANRYERCRYLNNMIIVRGDDANLSKKTSSISNVSASAGIITYTTSSAHTFVPGDVVTITGVNPSAYNLSNATIATTPLSNTFTINNSATGAYVSGGSVTAVHFTIQSGSNHIHLNGTGVDFSRNAPTDELRLAFSVISKNGSSPTPPGLVRILVEFASTDIENSGEFARLELELTDGNGSGGTYDFTNNRYYAISKQLQNLYMTPNFTWNAVTTIKIYTSIQNANVPTNQYYIAYDALRLENVSTINPLYGLTGYSVIKNDSAQTIIKSPNTSNYIEFRFNIGVS